LIGFHVDMNMAQYRADYLIKWLRELARCGYNTIVWEVENNVAWETCPECASPDAFTKDAFREVLAECRAAELEPIPLLQTIGHAEYVLKHERYRHLRELPDRIDQYCPRNPDLVPFLEEWIGEYVDLFSPASYFHLGADEAWSLGSCPRCRAYAEATSLSQLYIDHVNAVAALLIRRGITPIIWADMVLHYHEALDALSRDVMLFDWMYNIYRGSGEVWVWGKGMQRKEDFDEALLAKFGPYLFPMDGEAGQEPETFYTADFLAAQGFRVVTCPASSSYGDNIFTPRSLLHMANTFDSFHKGLSSHLCGSVLTSWSVHLFPWELQLATIDLPGFVHADPGASIEDFQTWFTRERFGTDDASFWQACDLLSNSCLFTHTSSLGYDKACLPVAEDHVQRTLTHIGATGRLEEEIKTCHARREEYSQALRHLEAFAQKITKGETILDLWKLAARNLINRAEASAFLLEHADAVVEGRAASGSAGRAARRILHDLRALRRETDELYQTMIRPTRKDEMIGYMYGAVEAALTRLAGEQME